MCARPSSASGNWCSGALASSRAGRWRWAWCAGASSGDSAAFVGLPGNPVAVFVTFARVVRPLLLCLAGAKPLPSGSAACARRIRLPQEDRPPRICAGQARQAADGVVEAVNIPQEGAGVITSLTETDGLVELART